MKVLLIEDNIDLQATLGDYLLLHEVDIDFASNAKLALTLIAQHSYDVIILDVMLPDGTGFDVCKKAREELACQTPILFLSARDTIEDKLEGFQTGADDYQTKPFELQELYVRLKALASRGNRADIGIIQKYGVSLDANLKQVNRGGKAIKLNPTEYKILQLLMRKSPHVIKRTELEEAVWEGEMPDSDSLRSHIYRLRTKLDKPFAEKLIQNIHGVGFQFCSKVELKQD